LLDVAERARRGEDTSDVAPYPGPPETWPPTGLEHLSDEELLSELRRAKEALGLTAPDVSGERDHKG
jgi:hypothetical protein